MSEDLSGRVRKSIIALQGRQALILAMNLGVGIILARKLDPEIFGLYGIAMFCLSLITMATNFGLAASLVQRKEEFGEHEISVAFTLQSGVSILAAALLWFLAPLSLLVYRSAPPELVWIIRSLAVPILFSPIITIVRLQLERSIQFQKIATIDVLGMVVGNAATLFLVFADHGIWSFVWGNLAGTFATAIVSWFMAKFRPRIAFDRKLSRQLFSFGMFFQFEMITNEAAGWIIPLISGASLGPAAVGLLTWASSNGRRPLMIVDNVMKVAFPHFARLQENPSELGRQVGLYFRRLLLVCYAWALLGWFLGEPMTRLVYTDKWLPGLAALQLFALGLGVDVANWVGGMTLTAIGGVRQTAKWTLVKSVLAIGCAFGFIPFFGMEGIPLASIVASAVSGAGIFHDLGKRMPLNYSDLWKPSLPFIALGLAFLPLLLSGGTGLAVGRWALGAVAIAWTVWKGLKEFRAPKPVLETTEGA